MEMKSSATHIKKGNPERRKRFWVLAFLLGACVAVYQTVFIIYEFVQFPMSDESFREPSQQKMGITLCVNKQWSAKAWQENDITKINIFMKMKQLSPSCNPRNPSEFCLSLLDERERYEIGIPLKNYIVGGVTKHDYELTFNNLKYGNCITHAFVNNNITSFIFYINEDAYFNNKAIMVLHHHKTAPVFSPNNIILVNNGRNTLDTAIKKEIYSVSKVFSSRICIEDDVESSDPWTILEKKRTNRSSYRYSQEKCLDQCYYNLVKKYCKCIIPESMPHRNSEAFPICAKPLCKKLPSGDVVDLCPCKPECKKEIYIPDLQQDGNDYQTQISQVVFTYFENKLGPISSADAMIRNMDQIVTARFKVVMITKAYVTDVLKRKPNITVESAFSESRSKTQKSSYSMYHSRLAKK